MRDSMVLFPGIPQTPKLPLVTILLVDDNAMNRAIMKRFITNYLKLKHIKPDDIEFDQAINGLLAIDMVARRLDNMKPHYDVIIMDLNMGPSLEEGGLFATKTIRVIEREAAIEKPAYIIRYSTEKPEPTEDELKEQGFDAMLNKHKTKPAEVNTALELALKNHPAFKQDDVNPRHSN